MLGKHGKDYMLLQGRDTKGKVEKERQLVGHFCMLNESSLQFKT